LFKNMFKNMWVVYWTIVLVAVIFTAFGHHYFDSLPVGVAIVHAIVESPLIMLVALLGMSVEETMD